MRELRSELRKHRSTRTDLGLVAAMLGLVVLAELLHGLALPAGRLGDPAVQLMVLGRGEFLAVLFAALLGALSFTAEIRHGTIRPTFLVSPGRSRVVWAKVSVSLASGAALGLAAGAVATTVGTAVLSGRGIDVRLDGSDHWLLVAGSAVAGALWAAIGVGVGAIVRNQVPTLIGVCGWLLFVEGLAVGDVGGLQDVGKYLPGAAAAAVSGQDPASLLAPAAGLVVLAAYAATFALIGSYATSHRDVA